MPFKELAVVVFSVPPVSLEVAKLQLNFLGKLGMYLNQARANDEESEYMEALYRVWFKRWPQTSEDVNDDAGFLNHREELMKKQICKDLFWHRITKEVPTDTWQEFLALEEEKLNEATTTPPNSPEPIASPIDAQQADKVSLKRQAEGSPESRPRHRPSTKIGPRIRFRPRLKVEPLVFSTPQSPASPVKATRDVIDLTESDDDIFDVFSGAPQAGSSADRSIDLSQDSDNE